ncbi:MAG: hypothetical protein COC19_05755 [SAR86 cluster bacterium]|uniref:Uncharacterized protein n=1 Tax=SAR86 cluster bacterium TaxID=2030880 RepID=A0A2A4MLD5_9GAMM|nr:MAG: hypothetical protein COC19_05755 [SAR86 cluster bacterium]
MIRALAISLCLSWTSLACTSLAAQTGAQLEDDTDVKFAFHSSAWGENENSGLRLLMQNLTENTISLESIHFSSDASELENPKNSSNASILIQVDTQIRAKRYAELELTYRDLLSGDACVSKTLTDNWKLVEISNYTLNPSVRNLIIEDTASFRIFQCARRVHTVWTDLNTMEQHQYDEWVLYHFERRTGG